MRRLTLAALLLTAACGGGTPAPPFRAVADTKLLMADVVERQAQIVWDAVGTIVTAEGTQEIRPKSDEDWMKVKAAAVNLTEAGNLLMMAPRAQDGDRWMKNVQRMMAESEKLMASADRKDPQQIFDQGAELYESCVACHTQYMPAIKDLYR
jgi:cytochrome c556